MRAHNLQTSLPNCSGQRSVKMSHVTWLLAARNVNLACSQFLQVGEWIRRVKTERESEAAGRRTLFVPTVYVFAFCGAARKRICA